MSYSKYELTVVTVVECGAIRPPGILAQRNSTVKRSIYHKWEQRGQRHVNALNIKLYIHI